MRIVVGQVCSGVSVLYLKHMTPSRITTTSKHAGLSYKCPARKHSKNLCSDCTHKRQNTHINTAIGACANVSVSGMLRIKYTQMRLIHKHTLVWFYMRGQPALALAPNPSMPHLKP